MKDNFMDNLIKTMYTFRNVENIHFFFQCNLQDGLMLHIKALTKNLLYTKSNNFRYVCHDLSKAPL